MIVCVMCVVVEKSLEPWLTGIWPPIAFYLHWMGSLSPIPLPPLSLGLFPGLHSIFPLFLLFSDDCNSVLQVRLATLGQVYGSRVSQLGSLHPRLAYHCAFRVICSLLVQKSNSAWTDHKLLSVGYPLGVGSVSYWK